jgi:hypothetical protein
MVPGVSWYAFCNKTTLLSLAFFSRVMANVSALFKGRVPTHQGKAATPSGAEQRADSCGQNKVTLHNSYFKVPGTLHRLWAWQLHTSQQGIGRYTAIWPLPAR